MGDGAAWIADRIDERFDDRGQYLVDFYHTCEYIESSHRSIAQQRLKRPGAWWSPKQTEHMLALRITRANDGWEHYWRERIKQAA